MMIVDLFFLFNCISLSFVSCVCLRNGMGVHACLLRVISLRVSPLLSLSSDNDGYEFD
jgi:hypothetical protein